MQQWGKDFAFFRQLLPALPVALTFGALTPAWPRPAFRPVPGLTFSMQSCVFAVKLEMPVKDAPSESDRVRRYQPILRAWCTCVLRVLPG